MRIWFLPFEELSDQHLLGQHKEWGLMNAMLQSPRFVKHPLVMFFRDKKPWLADYHDRAVEEMDHRYNHFHRYGGRHPTPVPPGYELGLERWAPPREFILYDMLDIAARYQLAPAGKYRWTNRPQPEWSQDKLALRVRFNEAPAHQHSWYGTVTPFANDARTRKAVAEWEDKYGWLMDAWLELGIYHWPYNGTHGVPAWRQL